METRFKIDFIKKFPIFLAVSIFIIVGGLVFTFIRGVNVDIMFKGGTIINYSYTGDIDFDTVAATVNESINYEVSVTGATDNQNNKNFVVTFNGTKSITIDEQQTLIEALKTKFADNEISKLSDTSVNASNGREFFMRCLIAVIFSFAALLVYIGIRFRRIGGWTAGFCGIFALIHDVLIVFVTSGIFGFVIGDTFMAVVLTILGFSLNDTIVIFDRIRENRDIHGSKLTIEECTNLSINQTLIRTINTSLCAISAMIIVCIVAMVFGVESIISFAVPMVTGMIAGVYSTVCFAAPLWVAMKNGKSKKKAHR